MYQSISPEVKKYGETKETFDKLSGAGIEPEVGNFISENRVRIQLKGREIEETTKLIIMYFEDPELPQKLIRLSDAIQNAPLTLFDDYRDWSKMNKQFIMSKYEKVKRQIE